MPIGSGGRAPVVGWVVRGRVRRAPERSLGGVRRVLERSLGRCRRCRRGQVVIRTWGGSPARIGYRILPNRHRGSSLTASPVAGQLGCDPACLRRRSQAMEERA
jgi:hypothetical protein